MPLQNRVDPFSQIQTVPERGAWMGNRGCLHDADGRIRRSQMSRHWLICTLEFRGIRRPLMKPGRYTELFFLDEVTALAAGHRPCHACRREAAQRFRSLAGLDSLAALDDVLHQERVGGQPILDDWRSLPPGAMIGRDGAAFLIWNESLWTWSFGGYRPAPDAEAENQHILTPATTLRVLRAGYRPQVHASAGT